MTIIAKTETQLIEGFDSEEVRVIRTLIDPTNKLNLEQIKLFLHVCKEKQLDPRMKQIYAVPRNNKHTGKTELTIQVSIDGLRMIAERTGKYSPGKETEYLRDDKGKLLGATAFVKKLTPDGTWHEVSAMAYLVEYMPRYNAQFWNQMPHVMIEKCAEAKALRRAFPGDLSGLYSDDEMSQSKKQEVPLVEPVQVELECITELQAIHLNMLLQSDDKYRDTLMNFLSAEYKATKLEEMPALIHDRVLSRIMRNNAKREATYEIEE